MNFRRSYRKSNFLSFVAGFLVLSVATAAAGHGIGVIEGDFKISSARLYAEQSSGSEAAGHAERFFRLDTEKIRFSQATYSENGTLQDGREYSVEGNAQWLREHPDQDFPWGAPIRIFRKEAYMDEWGPATAFGYAGDPKHLVNGEIYTLDHRRLVAYKRAGRKSIPVQWADLNTVRDQRWKFSTADGGLTIAPQR